MQTHGISKYSNDGCRCDVCRKEWALCKKIYRLRPSVRKKDNARSLLDAAVRRKEISITPCDVCGDDEVQAHHNDYDKPLEIRWLCRLHHKAVDGSSSPKTRLAT